VSYLATFGRTFSLLRRVVGVVPRGSKSDSNRLEARSRNPSGDEEREKKKKKKRKTGGRSGGEKIAAKELASAWRMASPESDANGLENPASATTQHFAYLNYLRNVMPAERVR